MRGPLLLLPLLLLGLAAPAARPDAAAALREGNRHFQAGDLEGAMAAYTTGWDGSDALLAYNLGTTAHHLGRLPEALLWYRRAEAAHADDPWLRENLELVRARLPAGSPDPPQASLWTFWMDHRCHLLWTGAFLAWTVLPALLLPPRLRRAALLLLALAAGLPFAAGLLLDQAGPRAAVLLADCPGPAGKLPAGREVRVFPSGGKGWRIAGTDSVCPARAVGLIDP